MKVREEVAEKKLLAALADQIGAERFDLWFGAGMMVRIDEEKIIFSVIKRFAADWIQRNFQKEIDRASFQVFGKSLPIAFTVRKAGETDRSGSVVRFDSPVVATNSDVVAPSIPPCHSPLYSIVANPKPQVVIPPEKDVKRLIALSQSPKRPVRRFATLKTFVEGLSNRLAWRAADLAVNHSGKINPIYLFGPTSVGKTHLLEGIWSAVRVCHNRKPPLYLTTEQFISGYLESIQSGSSRDSFQRFRDKFKGISILLVDDIQYLFRKDATQTEFLYTLDSLRSQGVQIVLTGDRPLNEMIGLKREIISRIEAGVVCGIEQPERETSLIIFQNMVAQRQLPIGTEVCRMVVSRLGTHARQLSGALNRLHAVHLATGEAISLPVAEETLADLIRCNRRNVQLKDIERAVCETFGLSEQSLQSKNRTKQVSTPRMLAMWLARKYTRSALSEIGKYFGDRSHSSVISAQKKVDAWVDTNHSVHAEDHDIPISEAIQKIERMLQAG